MWDLHGLKTFFTSQIQLIVLKTAAKRTLMSVAFSAYYFFLCGIWNVDHPKTLISTAICSNCAYFNGFWLKRKKIEPILHRALANTRLACLIAALKFNSNGCGPVACELFMKVALLLLKLHLIMKEYHYHMPYSKKSNGLLCRCYQSFRQ